MRKCICLTLFVLGAVFLSSIAYLFDRRHKNSDISKKWLIEDDGLYNANLLTNQLRPAQKHIKNMNKMFDSMGQIPDCEVIHIAVVCTGHAATRDVVLLIKSILFNRKRPIHFHFISDSTAHHILKYMFKTWEIPSVTTSFYSTSRAKNQTVMYDKSIVDIENLYKLILPMILPHEVHRVILLETAVIVNVDIAELWTLFDIFENKEAIGAVENQNLRYLETLRKTERKLPLLGKGLNTGVLLYDLERLRKIGFVDKAISITQTSTPGTKFSYEDIFNAVLLNYVDMLQYLPEKWNIQLSKDSSLDYCDNSVITDLKIIQGYSYNDFTLNSRCMDVFRKLHSSFLELSGNLLKRELSVCKTSLPSTEKLSFLFNKTDNCLDFRIQQANIFRTHLYFIEYDYKTKINDVTIVTQMTMERLVMFNKMCKHWEGPISIALHLTEIEAYEFLNFVKGSSLRTRKNIGYHIVYKEGTTGLYPYNYLRNVALENVRTPYVFLTDVDYLPAIGMYQRLRTDVLKKMDNKLKKAFVVPAFEQTRFNINFPKNKQELLTQLDKRQIIPVRFNIFSKGHWATDYPKWILATAPYKVNYGPYYEPYMVLPRTIPRYDTRFVGWGWDKTSHTMELDADGYEFLVLPDLFIIHIPHTVTYHRTMYFADSKYISCVKSLKKEFLNYLAAKYGQRGEGYKQLYKNLYDNTN